MHISDKDAAGLCASVLNNGTLRHLDLSNNDLGDKSAIALGAALSVGRLGTVRQHARGRGPWACHSVDIETA
jgi:hypothetical protein